MQDGTARQTIGAAVLVEEGGYPTQPRHSINGSGKRQRSGAGIANEDPRLEAAAPLLKPFWVDQAPSAALSGCLSSTFPRTENSRPTANTHRLGEYFTALGAEAINNMAHL